MSIPQSADLFNLTGAGQNTTKGGSGASLVPVPSAPKVEVANAPSSQFGAMTPTNPTQPTQTTATATATGLTPTKPYYNALDQMSSMARGNDQVMDQLQRSTLSTQSAQQGAEQQGLQQQLAQADVTGAQAVALQQMQERDQNLQTTQTLSDLSMQRGERQNQATQQLASQALQAHELDSIIANRDANTVAQNLSNFEEELSYIDLTTADGIDNARVAFEGTMGNTPKANEFWNSMDFTDIQNQQFNAKENTALTNLGTHLSTVDQSQFYSGTDADGNYTGFSFFNGDGSFKDGAMKDDSLRAAYYAMNGAVPGAEADSVGEFIQNWDNLDMDTKQNVMDYLDESADDFVKSETTLAFKNMQGELQALVAEKLIAPEDFELMSEGMAQLFKQDMMGGLSVQDDDDGTISFVDSNGVTLYDIEPDGTVRDLTEDTSFVDKVPTGVQPGQAYVTEDGGHYMSVNGAPTEITANNVTPSIVNEWIASDGIDESQQKILSDYITNANDLAELDQSTIKAMLNSDNEDIIDSIHGKAGTISYRGKGRNDGSRRNERAKFDGLPGEGGFVMVEGELYRQISDPTEYNSDGSYGQKVVLQNVKTGKSKTRSILGRYAYNMKNLHDSGASAGARWES